MRPVDAAQKALGRQEGCDVMQGHLVSEPQPMEKIRDLLPRRAARDCGGGRLG